MLSTSQVTARLLPTPADISERNSSAYKTRPARVIRVARERERFSRDASTRFTVFRRHRHAAAARILANLHRDTRTSPRAGCTITNAVRRRRVRFV